MQGAKRTHYFSYLPTQPENSWSVNSKQTFFKAGLSAKRTTEVGNLLLQVFLELKSIGQYHMSRTFISNLILKHHAFLFESLKASLLVLSYRNDPKFSDR